MCNGKLHYHFHVRMPGGKTILLSEINYEPDSNNIYSDSVGDSTIGHLYLKVADRICDMRPFVLCWKNTELVDMKMNLRDVCINNTFLPLCLTTGREEPIEMYYKSLQL